MTPEEQVTYADVEEFAWNRVRAKYPHKTDDEISAAFYGLARRANGLESGLCMIQRLDDALAAEVCK